jgi:hypothetical protein
MSTTANYVRVGDVPSPDATVTTSVRAPKWHGTLMTGSMVLATLADRKRMTRRVLTSRNSEGNFKPEELDLESAWVDPGLGGGAYLKAYLRPEVSGRLGEPQRDTVHRLYSRYVIGDRLWIREAWRQVPRLAGCERAHPADEHYGVRYRATWDKAHSSGWKPSIHMPRWASRITLEVTGVRPERLHSISEEDAIAEGVDFVSMVDVPRQATTNRRTDFKHLWNHLNEPRGHGWVKNPLVWVIEFRRLS